MKRKPRSKEQILAELRQVKKTKDTILGNRVCLILMICILYDMWEFSSEDINKVMDQYYELLDSYNSGNEDIDAWIDGIKRETGIDILGEG